MWLEVQHPLDPDDAPRLPQRQMVRLVIIELKVLQWHLSSLLANHGCVFYVIRSCTISAIIVILVILAFLIFTIRDAERRNETKMRTIMHQSVLMGRNEAAWELCRRVHEQYPDACPGLDFTFKEDNRGVFVDEWKLPHPRPKVNRVDTKKSHLSDQTNLPL